MYGASWGSLYWGPRTARTEIVPVHYLTFKAEFESCLRQEAVFVIFQRSEASQLSHKKARCHNHESMHSSDITYPTSCCLDFIRGQPLHMRVKCPHPNKYSPLLDLTLRYKLPKGLIGPGFILSNTGAGTWPLTRPIISDPVTRWLCNLFLTLLQRTLLRKSFAGI